MDPCSGVRGTSGLGLTFGISTGFLNVNRGVFYIAVVAPPLVVVTALENLDNLSRVGKILVFLSVLGVYPPS